MSCSDDEDGEWLCIECAKPYSCSRPPTKLQNGFSVADVLIGPMITVQNSINFIFAKTAILITILKTFHHNKELNFFCFDYIFDLVIVDVVFNCVLWFRLVSIDIYPTEINFVIFSNFEIDLYSIYCVKIIPE